MRVTSNTEDFKPAKSRNPPSLDLTKFCWRQQVSEVLGTGVGDCSFLHLYSTSIFCFQILECVAKCFLIGESDSFSRNAIRMVFRANKNSVPSFFGIYLLSCVIEGHFVSIFAEVSLKMRGSSELYRRRAAILRNKSIVILM